MAFENLNLGLLHKRTPKAGVFLNAYDKSQARSDIKRQQGIENQLNEAKLRLEQEKAEVAERQVSSLEKYHTSIAATQQQNADTAAGRLSMEQGQLASDNKNLASLRTAMTGAVANIGQGGTPPTVAAGQQAVQGHFINQPVVDSTRNIEKTRDILKVGIMMGGKAGAISANYSRVLEAETQTDIAIRNMETEQINEGMGYLNTDTEGVRTNLAGLKKAYPNNSFWSSWDENDPKDIKALQSMAQQSDPKQVMFHEKVMLPDENGKMQEGTFVVYGDGTNGVSAVPTGMQRGTPRQGLIKEALENLGFSAELMALINGPKDELDAAFELPYDNPKSYYAIHQKAVADNALLEATKLLALQAGVRGEGGGGYLEKLKIMGDQSNAGVSYGIARDAQHVKNLSPNHKMSDALIRNVFGKPGMSDEEMMRNLHQFELDEDWRIVPSG